MPAYATPEDYTRYCPDGILLGNYDRLPIMMEKASTQINGLCYGRIQRSGFENLTEFQQECIRQATCLHVEFLTNYADALESPLQSYGINGVSMTFDANRVRQQGGVTTSGEVYGLLLQTGLAHRGVW